MLAHVVYTIRSIVSVVVNAFDHSVLVLLESDTRCANADRDIVLHAAYGRCLAWCVFSPMACVRPRCAYRRLRRCTVWGMDAWYKLVDVPQAGCRRPCMAAACDQAIQARPTGKSPYDYIIFSRTRGWGTVSWTRGEWLIRTCTDVRAGCSCPAGWRSTVTVAGQGSTQRSRQHPAAAARALATPAAALSFTGPQALEAYARELTRHHAARWGATHAPRTCARVIVTRVSTGTSF